MNFLFRVFLNRLHLMVPVVMVGVSVHQEFQASQEALDPRDQQVLRDHPVIMDLKDPWAHEETKVMKELVEDRDHQASKELKDLQVHVGTKVKQVRLVPPETRVIQVLVEVKVFQVQRDLKVPQVQLVPLETRAIRVPEETQVQRVLQDRLVVIGNNAFLRNWAKARTPD